MTISDFLAEIEALQTNWYLRPSVLQSQLSITSHDNGWVTCPIGRLAQEKTGKRYLSSDYIESAQVLGLSEGDREKIVSAADDTAAAEPSLRARLILACRL